MNKTIEIIRTGKKKILKKEDGTTVEVECGDNYSEEFGTEPCISCGHGDCSCCEDE